MVVGKPLSQMLLKKNATVTICHTKTVDLRKEVKEADFVFACAGVAKMLDASYIIRKIELERSNSYTSIYE